MVGANSQLHTKSHLRYQRGFTKFDYPAKILNFLKMSRPALGPTQPSI
jgi:hypothetical protein